jgi:hypothetical protein
MLLFRFEGQRGLRERRGWSVDCCAKVNGRRAFISKGSLEQLRQRTHRSIAGREEPSIPCRLPRAHSLLILFCRPVTVCARAPVTWPIPIPFCKAMPHYLLLGHVTAISTTYRDTLHFDAYSLSNQPSKLQSAHSHQP